ncbi:glycosyltransferase family 2 protein [Azospirillum melinis]
MKWSSLHQFGHDGLGPIVNTYLNRLHAYLRQCDGSDHKILFALRAGVRIEELYGTWLSARRIEPPANMAFLKISRMMGIKAAYTKAPALAVTALGQELAGASLNEVITCLLNPEIKAGRCPKFPEISPAPIHEFLERDDELSSFVKRYLRQQSELYARYLSGLVGDAQRILFVDSGWRGTAQLLLEAAFPEYAWEGIYFGCIGRAEVLSQRPAGMHGLIFDSEAFEPEKPETAFLVHRHLIESLLEPGIASVEHIELADVGAIVDGADLLREEWRENWDEVYDGVKAYIADHATMPLSKAIQHYHVAMDCLADVICYPSADDVLYVCGKTRSHDVGRSGGAMPVLASKDRFQGDTPDLRIQQAIWQTGQTALEIPTAKRRKAQQRSIVASLQCAMPVQYVIARADSTPVLADAGTPRVAIITRTKDRPVLLKRAADSVACQTLDSYSWVIVNDGGDLDDVLEVVNGSLVDPQKVTICANAKSLGMEAASNVGIRSSRSEYIVIHDDDDSWHPDFLKETVAFLDRNRHIYGGVLTHSTYISEEICGQSVVEHDRWPYNDWVENVQLSEMAIGNFFPPIAFVFQRKIWEDLGGFDEVLPVLGDWDFNIRFLLQADIGVLPKPLANYHHRDRSSATGAYSNSVIGGASRHAAYNAIVRNKYIRGAAKNESYAAVSALMGAGYAQADVRHRLESARHQLSGTSSKGPAPQSSLEEDVQSTVQKLAGAQQELDRRWIMVLMLSQELSVAKGLNTPLKDIVEAVNKAVDVYAERYVLPAPSDFDEEAYLRRYGDVHESVINGSISGAFDHYMKHGRKEGRQRATVKDM